MKKILFLILMVAGLKGFSQITYTPMTAAGYQFKYVKVDSGFALPLRDTSKGRGVDRPGLVVANSADSLPYMWTGSQWLLFGTAAITPTGAYVDSITVSGNNVFYWIAGTGTGKQLNKVDSLNKSNDSVYYYVGGTKKFAFMAGGTFTNPPNPYDQINDTMTYTPEFIVGFDNDTLKKAYFRVADIVGIDTAYATTDTTLHFKKGTTEWDVLFTVVSGGSTNVNIGSGYRWAVPNTNNVKTIFNGYAVLIDSASNTNGLTLKADTSLLLTKLLATATYQPILSLTTTGTSGVSTLTGSTLNVPNYATGGTYTAGLGLLLTGSQFKLDTSYGKKYFTYGLSVPNDSTVRVDSATLALTFLRRKDSTLYSTFYQNSLKLNITDTTNKWVANVTGINDSTIRVFKGTGNTDILIRGNGSGGGGGGANYWTLSGNDIYANPNTGTGQVGVGTNAAPTSKFQVKYDGVNTLSTTYATATDSTKGISLINDVPATVGQNQYSPLLRFRGSGWKTNATAGPQKIEWEMYSHALTGAASPTSTFYLQSSINASNWSANQFTFSSAGAFAAPGAGSFGGNVAGVSFQTSTAGSFNSARAPGATMVESLLFNGSAAATAGVPLQWSPSIRMISNAWDGTSANYFNEFFQQVRGVNGTIPTKAALWWSKRISTTATGTIVDLLSLNDDGKFTFLATNTTVGTTGAQTINKASGTVNLAAAGTSLVVTNSLVSTSSIVFAVIRTNDSNATSIKSVVPAAGSFTINVNNAPAAEISIGFFVIN